MNKGQFFLCFFAENISLEKQPCFSYTQLSEVLCLIENEKKSNTGI